MNEHETPPVRSRRRALHLLSSTADVLPTLVVAAVIAAVGWWGHRHAWKMPKFSALNGAQTVVDDWCATHSVPESICVECNELLMPKPKSFGWCKVHGIAECVLCHPELAQTKSAASVTREDLAKAKNALEFTTRPTTNPNCGTHHRRIQFTAVADVEKAGVAVEPVWTAPAVEFVAAPGEIVYDQSRIAHLSSRSPGMVWKVFKHLGDPVKAGEVLALVDAAEVGKAKAELLQAFASMQLKQETLAAVQESGGAVPAARAREAEAGLREAEIRMSAACQALTNLGLPIDEGEARSSSAETLKARLKLLGIPRDVANAIDAKTTNLMPLFSPMDGVVVSREMVAGEVVDVSRILFEVVDVSGLWLTFDVKGEEARRLKIGQPVRFTSDAGGDELTGTLAFISTQADPKTRTVKVRANLDDAHGKQRANTFGSGRVILREEEKAISVPNDAVQWDGCCNIVFVRDKDFLKADSHKVFHVRKVRVAARDEKNTEVVGVLQGELVATKGSGLLLTELLRGSLGEGCACCSKK